MHAAVYAAAVAERSVLGSVPAGGRCDNASHAHASSSSSSSSGGGSDSGGSSGAATGEVSSGTVVVALGSAYQLPVSLCDFEGLGVDHQLPRGTLAQVDDQPLPEPEP